MTVKQSACLRDPPTETERGYRFPASIRWAQQNVTHTSYLRKPIEPKPCNKKTNSYCRIEHLFLKNIKLKTTTMKANYVVEMVNYSKENGNTEAMTNPGFPQRFGFPVVVNIDGVHKFF